MRAGGGWKRCSLRIVSFLLLSSCICYPFINAYTNTDDSVNTFSAYTSVLNNELMLHLSDESHDYHISLRGLSSSILTSTELLFTIKESHQKPIMTIVVNSPTEHGDHEVEDEHDDNDNDNDKDKAKQTIDKNQPSSYQMIDPDQWNENDPPIWIPSIEHTAETIRETETQQWKEDDYEHDLITAQDDKEDDDDDEEEDDNDEYDATDDNDESFSSLNMAASRRSVRFPSYEPGVQPLLSLVMIVKNEAAGLAATLESTYSYIDHYCIVDTGSTDGTLDIIRSFYASLPASVTHDIFHEPFIDFSTTRNRALVLTGNHTEFVLMMNGDDRLYGGYEMRSFLETRRGLTAQDEAIYIITIDYGGLAKGRSERLARTSNHFVSNWPNDDWNHWRYEGVTHEAYVSNAALAAGAKIIFTDEIFGIYHDITNDTPEKKNDRFRLDILLLLRDLESHPNTYNTPRNMYYLAQSYYNLHDYKEATKWYLKRVAVNYQRPTPLGEDNEKQRAYSLLAYMSEQMGEDWSVAEKYWKKSYEACPTAYALYSLAKLYRDQGYPDRAKKYAEKSRTIIMGKGSPIVCNGDDGLVQKHLPSLLSSLRADKTY